MPADVETRNQIAGFLTAFIRGKYSKRQFVRLIKPFQADIDKQSGSDSYLEYFLFEINILLNWLHQEKSWVKLKRHLAYLLSDLDEDDSPEASIKSIENASAPSNQNTLPRCHLVAIITAMIVACYTTLWLIPAVSSLSLLIFTICGMETRKDSTEASAEKTNIESFYPFANREEWLTHRHNVDELHLPGDSACIEVYSSHQSRLSRFIYPIFWYSSIAIFSIIITVAILYFVFIASFCWPAVVLYYSFFPPRS